MASFSTGGAIEKLSAPYRFSGCYSLKREEEVRESCPPHIFLLTLPANVLYSIGLIELQYRRSGFGFTKRFSEDVRCESQFGRRFYCWWGWSACCNRREARKSPPI